MVVVLDERHRLRLVHFSHEPIYQFARDVQWYDNQPSPHQLYYFELTPSTVGSSQSAPWYGPGTFCLVVLSTSVRGVHITIDLSVFV
jgi:hypothetical protein